MKGIFLSLPCTLLLVVVAGYTHITTEQQSLLARLGVNIYTCKRAHGPKRLDQGFGWRNAWSTYRQQLEERDMPRSIIMQLVIEFLNWYVSITRTMRQTRSVKC